MLAGKLPALQQTDRKRILAYSSISQPALSLALAAALPSLAGIPVTVVLLAKFHAVAWGSMGGMVCSSIIIAMTGGEASSSDVRSRDAAGGAGRRLGHAVLAALARLPIGLGAYPTPLLTLICAAASKGHALTDKACKIFTFCGNLNVLCLALSAGGCREEVISRSLCHYSRGACRLQLTQRRLAEGDAAEHGGRLPAVRPAAPE